MKKYSKLFRIKWKSQKQPNNPHWSTSKSWLCRATSNNKLWRHFWIFLRSLLVHHPCDDVGAYDGAEGYQWVARGVHLPTAGGWREYLSVRVQCPDSPSWSRPVWRSDRKCSTLHYPRFESRPWNTCRCMPGVPFCLSDQGFLWEVRCMQSPVATCQSLKVFFRMEKSEREREAPQRRRWYLMRWKKYRRNFNWGNVHKWRHNYYFYLLQYLSFIFYDGLVQACQWHFSFLIIMKTTLNWMNLL